MWLGGDVAAVTVTWHQPSQLRPYPVHLQPILARINVCPSLQTQPWDIQVATVVHELFHGLGFVASRYTAVALPRVARLARWHGTHAAVTCVAVPSCVSQVCLLPRRQRRADHAS